MVRDSMVVSNFWLEKSSHEPVNSTTNDIINDLNQIMDKHCPTYHRTTKPIFDKLILVVIDALGSQFLPSTTKQPRNDSDRMPFLEQLIRDGNAQRFVAKAATPTVTMPRIKSIVSGTIPSFLDIVYNLARDVSDYNEDNFINIAKNQNKSIVFYGDDTWLSLFREQTFARIEKTASFFATDYTSVDTNVTRRALPETELENIDWDFMILHYLGLDHIGHVYGSNEHFLIRDKLLEMDLVIQKIHKNMSKRDSKTLVVILGDHGMSQQGNHGGSSSLEVETALIFLPINRNFSNSDTDNQQSTDVLQIDIATTISQLFGLAIPKMSKGVAIEKVMNGFLAQNQSYLACAALDNLSSLIKLFDIDVFNEMPERAKILELLAEHSSSQNDLKEIANSYSEVSRKLQTRLMTTFTNNRFPILMSVIISVIILISLMTLRKISIQLQFPTLTNTGQVACLAVFFAPIVMLGSTNYIEYEHLFWPIFSIGTLLVLVSTLNLRLESLKPLHIYLFIFTYILSCLWNNLQLCRGDSILSIYITPTLSLLILCNSLKKNSDLMHLRLVLPLFVCFIIMITKIVEESSKFTRSDHISFRSAVQTISMIIVLCFNILTIYSHLSKKEPRKSPLGYKLSSGYLLVAFLLARRYNFFFLICNVIMETNLNSILDSLGSPAIVRILVYINFAQSAFYNQGNSNLFTTIDIRPAFYGQTEYSLSLATILVSISTYSAQLYWIMKLFQRIHDSKRDSGGRLNDVIGYFIIIRNFLSISYYMYVCEILRNHLFIWSVLSPKMVYHFVTNQIQILVVILLVKLPVFEEKLINTISPAADKRASIL